MRKASDIGMIPIFGLLLVQQAMGCSQIPCSPPCVQQVNPPQRAERLNTVKCKPRDVGATVNAQIYGHSCESLEGWGSTTPSICSVGGRFVLYGDNAVTCEAAGDCVQTITSVTQDTSCECPEYKPCAGKNAGDICSRCAPYDFMCMDTGVVKYCGADGCCSSGGGMCPPPPPTPAPASASPTTQPTQLPTPPQCPAGMAYRTCGSACPPTCGTAPGPCPRNCADGCFCKVEGMFALGDGSGCVEECPTQRPTPTPTAKPTLGPTANPTEQPTDDPTANPTKQPTASPTLVPTATPTAGPTPRTTMAPTLAPTLPTAAEIPTRVPTKAGGTYAPTAGPTPNPTPPTASPTSPPTNTNQTAAPTIGQAGSPGTGPSISADGTGLAGQDPAAVLTAKTAILEAAKAERKTVVTEYIACTSTASSGAGPKPNCTALGAKLVAAGGQVSTLEVEVVQARAALAAAIGGAPDPTRTGTPAPSSGDDEKNGPDIDGEVIVVVIIGVVVVIVVVAGAWFRINNAGANHRGAGGAAPSQSSRPEPVAFGNPLYEAYVKPAGPNLGLADGYEDVGGNGFYDNTNSDDDNDSNDEI